MRHVSAEFLESTLRRGKSLEQFLGGGVELDTRVIRWLELRPTNDGIEVWDFSAPDFGDRHSDLYEFTADDAGILVITLPSTTEAIAHARDALGARDDRWVNQFVVQDEFLDFIAAGRPATWPPSTLG